MTYFEYNLVPCFRPHEPQLRMLPDLTFNLHVAQSIVDRVESFFQFETPWPTFSGHARPADRHDGKEPLLYVQMVDGTGAWRSFAFRGTGYVGVLNIEDRGKERAFFVDYLCGVEDGLRQEARSLDTDWAEGVLGLVVGGELVVHLPVG